MNRVEVKLRIARVGFWLLLAGCLGHPAGAMLRVANKLIDRANNIRAPLDDWLFNEKEK